MHPTSARGPWKAGQDGQWRHLPGAFRLAQETTPKMFPAPPHVDVKVNSWKKALRRGGVGSVPRGGIAEALA